MKKRGVEVEFFTIIQYERTEFGAVYIIVIELKKKKKNSYHFLISQKKVKLLCWECEEIVKLLKFQIVRFGPKT